MTLLNPAEATLPFYPNRPELVGLFRRLTMSVLICKEIRLARRREQSIDTSTFDGPSSPRISSSGVESLISFVATSMSKVRRAIQSQG